MKRARRRGRLSTAVGIILLAVMLFPVYWMVNASLQPTGNTLQGGWFPLHPDFSGYATALRDQGRNLVTSLVVAFGSVALSLGLAAPAAYALAHLPVRGTNLVLFGVLVTQMVPGIVVADALYGTYNDLGLLNSYLGLILADSTAGIPFAIIVLRSFMQGIPREIIEAARVDGAVAAYLPLRRAPGERELSGRSPSASTSTSALTRTSGTPSWPPPFWRPPRRLCCSSSLSATSPPGPPAVP